MDFIYLTSLRGCPPRGEMVKAMDCGIIVSEFELQLRYYVRFRGKYPWKRYELPLSSQQWVK